jgi:hypothetical protein
MRLILYRIVFSIIRLNPRPHQNNISLMQWTWPSEFSTPRSRIRSLLLLGSWWHRLQPSECCQVFENGLKWYPLTLNFNFGKKENHKVTNLENKKPVEALECTFLPEIHKLTMLCLRACCHDEACRISSPEISIQTCITLFLWWSRISR